MEKNIRQQVTLILLHLLGGDERGKDEVNMGELQKAVLTLKEDCDLGYNFSNCGMPGSDYPYSFALSRDIIELSRASKLRTFENRQHHLPPRIFICLNSSDKEEAKGALATLEPEVKHRLIATINAAKKGEL